MGDDEFTGKILFNKDNKFDLQLKQALIDEKRLAGIFLHKKIERVELKTERFLWEKYGNICVEIRRAGQPSGLSVTQADYWAHELRRDTDTACYLFIEVERLKKMARWCMENGRYSKGVGDDGLSDVVKIPLYMILR